MNWCGAPVLRPGSSCCSAGWAHVGSDLFGGPMRRALHRAQRHVLAGAAWLHQEDKELKRLSGVEFGSAAV